MYNSTSCGEDDGICFEFSEISFLLYLSIQGLTLVLIVDSSQDTALSKTFGFRIKIHDADEIAFPQEDGFIFEPGYMFTVSIGMVLKFINWN